MKLILTILLFVLPSFGAGLIVNPYRFGVTSPIAFVQNKAATSASSSTTVAVTPDAATAVGNAIVVYVDAEMPAATLFGDVTISVSDSVNGAYTLVRRSDAGKSFGGAVFYKSPIAAGSPTITATFGTASTKKSIVAYEYHWTGGSSFAADQSNDNGSSGGTTTVTSGNVTTTAAITLGFAGYSVNPFATGPNLSSRQINGVAADRNLATTGLTDTWDKTFSSIFTGQASATSPDNVWVNVLATFKVVVSTSTSLFTDDFNRANETPLAGNWSTEVGTDNMNLSGNKAVPSVDLGCIAFRNNVTWPADQYMQAKCTAGTSGTGTGPGVALRLDPSNRNLYLITIDTAGSITLARWNASSTYASLTTRSVTYVAGGVLRGEVTGTGATVSIKIFYQGVQQGATYSDTSADRITAAGKAGIGYSSSNTGSSVDDADGGSIP